nr:phospho-sugar mutase [Corynebacterium sp. 11A]
MESRPSEPHPAAPLVYGTTGFRAPVGPGPRQMNITLITRLAAAFAAWLPSHTTQRTTPPSRFAGDSPSEEPGIGRLLHATDAPIRVVVGWDTRYGSSAFAQAAAEVCAGAGFEVTLLPQPTPTPLIPFLIHTRCFDGGIQITASHNPAVDNGCKLYTRDGRLLSTDRAAEITALMEDMPPAPEIPRVHVRPTHDQLRRYVDYVVDLVDPGADDRLRVATERAGLTVVYTAMHGVTGRVLHQCLQAAGFALCYPVLSQQHPDPTFPTLAFPDPEEPSAVEQVLELAAHHNADLIIALDPDGDRCGIGIKTAAGTHRMLSADELGPLLATRLVSDAHADAPAPVVATTRVSSHLLKSLAAARGWDYQESATGFKNMTQTADDRPGQLAFAYEEAQGFCVDPARVPDKDGLATALITCAWAAELNMHGSSLEQELMTLHKRHGYYASRKVIIRTSDPQTLLEEAAAAPPQELAGIPLGPLPLLDDQIIGWSGSGEAGRVRILARTSGTESKAKIYIHVSGTDSAEHSEALLTRIVGELRELLGRL